MRHRIVRYALALTLAVVLSRPPRPVPAAEPQQAGHLERIAGICLAYVQGDPYQMGLQQGALLRNELRGLIQDYLYGRLMADSGTIHFWLLSQARLLDHQIPKALRREMQGIADGVGVSYQHVLLLNIVPDLQALTRKVPSWDLFPALFSSANQSVPPARASLCAAFAGWGRATVEGELLVGHNLDCAESDLLQRYLALIVRQPADGNAFVSLGLMGTVGVWAGMNEEKVIVALSSSPSVDVAVTGQPLPLLLRQALECTGSLTEAVSLLLSSERLYGGNVILGDGKVPQAVAIELSAHRHALFEADVAGDVLLRTNHFLDSELALAQQLVLSPEERAASELRMERLKDVLQLNQGWIGTDKALAFLESMDATPSGGMEGVGTLQTVLLNPARFTLWIAQRSEGTAPIDSEGAYTVSPVWGGASSEQGSTTTTTPYIQLDFAAELLGRR